MKKTIYSALFLVTSALIFAQTGRVGVNTETPKTTMDVSGKIGTDGKSLPTDMTGLQAPRLTREELTNKGTIYGADQKGALVYITDISGGDAGATTPRKNVTSVGYYYFDGTDWIKIGSGGSTSTDTSIYTVDGSITGTVSPSFTRTLNLNGSNMLFTGSQQRTSWSATGALGQTNLQSNTGSASFQLNGGNNTQLSLQQFNNGTAQMFTSLGSNTLDIGTNAITNSDGAPVRFFTSAGSGALGTEKARIQPDGKVGIATDDPTETLDVGAGNVKVRQINSNGSTNPSDKLVVADANGVLKTTSLFVPKTALVGNRTTASSTITAGATATVLFTTNPLLSGFTYNATTGEYTAETAGYYQISTTVVKDYSMNNPTGGTSFVVINVNGTVASYINNGYLDGTGFSSQNITYVVYLNANDKFIITTSYTRASRITSAQVSVIALGG